MITHIISVVAGVVIPLFGGLLTAVWLLLNRRVDRLEVELAAFRRELRADMIDAATRGAATENKLFDKLDGLTSVLSDIREDLAKNYVAKSDCNRRHG